MTEEDAQEKNQRFDLSKISVLHYKTSLSQQILHPNPTNSQNDICSGRHPYLRLLIRLHRPLHSPNQEFPR
jgi:hypothetical protein